MVRAVLKRELRRGDAIPKGYKLAWREPARGVCVFYPAVIHLAARAVRGICWRMILFGEAWKMESRERTEFRKLRTMTDQKQRLAMEYVRGYHDGWRECAAAIEEAIDEEQATQQKGLAN
jgi:hypothetical protein